MKINDKIYAIHSGSCTELVCIYVQKRTNSDKCYLISPLNEDKEPVIVSLIKLGREYKAISMSDGVIIIENSGKLIDIKNRYGSSYSFVNPNDINNDLLLKIAIDSLLSGTKRFYIKKYTENQLKALDKYFYKRYQISVIEIYNENGSKELINRFGLF